MSNKDTIHRAMFNLHLDKRCVQQRIWREEPMKSQIRTSRIHTRKQSNHLFRISFTFAFVCFDYFERDGLLFRNTRILKLFTYLWFTNTYKKTVKIRTENQVLFCQKTCKIDRFHRHFSGKTQCFKGINSWSLISKTIEIGEKWLSIQLFSRIIFLEWVIEKC